MDVQEKAALAACASLDNRRGLETLRLLIKNILDHPLENKFRDVSVAALSKRGLTLECLDFLYSVGFVKEGERLRFKIALDSSKLFEGFAAVEDILQQHAQYQAVEHIEGTSGSTSTTSDAIHQERVSGFGLQTSASALQEISGDVDQRFVEMGFPLAVVREALATAGSVDIDVVLPHLLSMTQSPIGSHIDPPRLARTVSCEHDTTPDIPRLERHLSNESRQVLHQTLGHNKKDAKDVARVLLLIAAALRQGLLTQQQKHELTGHVLRKEFDEVQSITKGMNIRATPEMIMASGEAWWDCQICFDRHDTHGWQCPSKHRFCCDCMQQHVDAVAFPKCPMCDYTLDEDDLLNLNVSPSRIDAFREAKLRGAVDTLAKAGECVVRCSSAECSNVVVLSSLGRQRFACGVCDAPDFCTRCRQSPYHYHGGCGHVQPLREQWVSWISGGREDYNGQVRTAAESDMRKQALCDGILRHNELEADERWKAQNCRHCPNCDRPISKVEGCDSMVCGRSYHGGDHQPGCGTEFNWASAKPYTAHIQRRELPAFEATGLRGKQVFHPFNDCSMCGAQGFAGLRFRCLHCPSFDVCSKCEPHLASAHPVDHVFEILFESDFRCPWLPRQTRVNIVRSGERKPQSVRRCAIADLEGHSGIVVNRRRGPVEAYFVELDLARGKIEIDPMFLEPIITSRDDAEQLLLKTVEEDGEDAIQASGAPVSRLLAIPNVVQDPRRARGLGRGVQDVLSSGDGAFDDDSPLSSENEVYHPMQHGRLRLNQPSRRRARVAM